MSWIFFFLINLEAGNNKRIAIYMDVCISEYSLDNTRKENKILLWCCLRQVFLGFPRGPIITTISIYPTHRFTWHRVLVHYYYCMQVSVAWPFSFSRGSPAESSWSLFFGEGVMAKCITYKTRDRGKWSCSLLVIAVTVFSRSVYFSPKARYFNTSYAVEELSYVITPFVWLTDFFQIKVPLLVIAVWSLHLSWRTCLTPTDNSLSNEEWNQRFSRTGWVNLSNRKFLTVSFESWQFILPKWLDC